MKPTRVAIFAKAPRPGRVKTRLIPALGRERAAQLAARLLVHTVREALEAHIGAVELCASPRPSHPDWHGVLPESLHRSLLWTAQGTGDLGERLARAAARIEAQGQAMLLIGTDCPALDAATLQHAALVLTQHDAVLIPSTDGGYVLLGLNRFHPAVFAGVPWSTARVAQCTRERFQEIGWRWAELPALTDIDEPGNLGALPAYLWEPSA